MNATFYRRCKCGTILAIPGLEDEVICLCGIAVTIVPPQLDFSQFEIHSALSSLENLGRRDFIKFP